MFYHVFYLVGALTWLLVRVRDEDIAIAAAVRLLALRHFLLLMPGMFGP